ncbi:L-lysine 2,3-aminomutase [Lachnellula willkommii]|uniref:L-lysine 2,3-aminomutase n=1 Tax=Lachnellula willkommii TaxID=215461 RepID=A0A559MJ06_9HELO|nr:L-lysine 2,3-aminomutase [Lachnellula willkommii]
MGQDLKEFAIGKTFHVGDKLQSSSFYPMDGITRSYAIGDDTEASIKASPTHINAHWNTAIEYIKENPAIQDIEIGGDSYHLTPEQLKFIGEALLNIDHVRRFHFTTRGLAATPSRILDPNDTWTDTLIQISKLGRKMGKHVAIQTHFNHPNEFSWVTREAAQRLFANGVTVLNQSVLLKGVNDSVSTMSALIRELADCNIKPVNLLSRFFPYPSSDTSQYYVSQCDMAKGAEDLRTPLSTVLHLETQLRGSIADFLMPQFVVNLPGGGGKRLAASYKSYDRRTGISTFVAPVVKGQSNENEVYEYFDPLHSLPDLEPLSRGLVFSGI